MKNRIDALIKNEKMKWYLSFDYLFKYYLLVQINIKYVSFEGNNYFNYIILIAQYNLKPR